MEIKELVEYAIEKEVMSRRMYESAAERCEDDEARMMVLQLAGFEAEHIEIFTQALKPEIKALNFDVPDFINTCETNPFNLSASFDQDALDNSSLEEILTIAKGFEKSMAEFYSGLSSMIKSETIASVGQRLATEEMSHFELITRIEDTLGLSPDTHGEEFHGH